MTAPIVPVVAACPSCGGLPIPNHPEGILAIDHSPTLCALRTFEDATKAADADRYWTAFRRPATPTELVLLAAVGYAVPATGTDTVVSYLSPGVRRRGWPDLPATAPAGSDQ